MASRSPTRRPRTSMSPPSQRLSQLLPGLYSARDFTLADQPLLKLLAVLGMELDAFARAVDQLWDDHFVERAGPQALPLLAELMGARLITDDPRVQRGVVARAVAWRRRKGTLASLEEVLSVTSLWDAEVDESFRSLLETQDLNDLLPWRGRSAVLWDPIGLADPLTRRSPGIERPRAGVPERGPFIGIGARGDAGPGLAPAGERGCGPCRRDAAHAGPAGLGTSGCRPHPYRAPDARGVGGSHPGHRAHAAQRLPGLSRGSTGPRWSPGVAQAPGARGPHWRPHRSP